MQKEEYVFNIYNKKVSDMSARQKEILSKYNYLTPIKKESYDEKKRTWNWLFRCDCGNEKIINMKEIRNNQTKSCGCFKQKNLNHNTGNLSKSWKGKTLIPLTYINSVEYRAKLKKYEYNLTEEYLYNLYVMQNCECKLSGMKLSIDLKNFTASIDRINSDIGYIEGNVQWVHKDVNYIKYNLIEKELYDICEKIRNKHGM